MGYCIRYAVVACWLPARPRGAAQLSPDCMRSSSPTLLPAGGKIVVRREDHLVLVFHRVFAWMIVHVQAGVQNEMLEAITKQPAELGFQAKELHHDPTIE